MGGNQRSARARPGRPRVEGSAQSREPSEKTCNKWGGATWNTWLFQFIRTPRLDWPWRRSLPAPSAASDQPRGRPTARRAGARSRCTQGTGTTGYTRRSTAGEAWTGVRRGVIWRARAPSRPRAKPAALAPLWRRPLYIDVLELARCSGGKKNGRRRGGGLQCPLGSCGGYRRFDSVADVLEHIATSPHHAEFRADPTASSIWGRRWKRPTAVRAEPVASAAELGVDDATYRALLALQSREIGASVTSSPQRCARPLLGNFWHRAHHLTARVRLWTTRAHPFPAPSLRDQLDVLKRVSMIFHSTSAR